jgi:serine/threonine-protein kinase
VSASAEGGIRFGQYVLLRRIARGGMAEVFLAQQKGLEGFDRRVAVKRILPHLADAPDFLKMFLGEAKLAAQLSHPNVVHIYDFGKVDTDYFIAMEFVDGVHAGQLFKHGEKERVPPTMVARIGADAATALHYAHELRNASGQPLGLVHRDVSPANIMVSFDGVVKLCDFGIAKAAMLGDQLTNPGQVKGKYAYMSPEQTIASPLDGRSDVFSLGIVLWELLAGKTIVGRGDAVEAMRAIRDGKLPSILQAAPKTPPALAKAITWALQTRREIRATAMDLAQALEQFIKSSPELATPMQVGAWVRQRFIREGTGQHPAIPIPGVSVGTRVSPGTMVASDTGEGPGTAVSTGTRAGTVTPPSSLIAASQVLTGDDLLETAETIAITGDRAHANETVLEPADRPTVMRAIAKPQDTGERATVPRPAAVPPAADGATVIVHDTVNETNMRSGAFRPQVAGGPAELATQIGARPLERKRTPVPLDMTAGTRRLRQRRALAIGGLVLLAVLSFVIALAARSPARSAARAPDAGPGSSALAIAPDAFVPIDAPADAPLDGFEPTIRPDAREDLTYLEIRTNPGGGNITVNGETRADPAKFALSPGHYKILAELDGYVPEHREVDLERGVDRVQDIAFRKRTPGTGRPAKPMGTLTVRTTPYSVVYSGPRKLGETPFANVELPAGTYVLVFKNPDRANVTKTVTITAGKTTKLSFAFP